MPWWVWVTHLAASLPYLWYHAFSLVIDAVYHLLHNDTFTIRNHTPKLCLILDSPYAEEFWKAAQANTETLKKLMRGLLFKELTTSRMSYLPPWLSRSSEIQTGRSRMSNVGSLLVETSKFKVLTSTRHTAVLFNGQPSGWCWSLNVSLVLIQAMWHHLWVSSCKPRKQRNFLHQDASIIQAGRHAM
jgi:hypothetical protein